jgi:hypothetical protein
MHQNTVEVSFKGEASNELAEMFDCVAVIVDRGVTRLYLAQDAATLHGILGQIDVLGLEVIDVRAVSEDQTDGGEAPAPSRPYGEPDTESSVAAIAGTESAAIASPTNESEM